jgi:hypothetical protein
MVPYGDYACALRVWPQAFGLFSILSCDIADSKHEGVSL